MLQTLLSIKVAVMPICIINISSLQFLHIDLAIINSTGSFLPRAYTTL